MFLKVLDGEILFVHCIFSFELPKLFRHLSANHYVTLSWEKKISLRIESANIRHQMQNYQFSKRLGFEMPPFISPPHNKINNFVTRANECTSFWYCLLFIDGSSWGYFFSLLEKKLLVRKFVDSNRSLTVKKKNNRTKKTKKRKKEPREILQEKRENI